MVTPIVNTNECLLCVIFFSHDIYYPFIPLSEPAFLFDKKHGSKHENKKSKDID